MAGLINAAPTARRTGASALANPVLQTMQNELEAKLTPENLDDYNKVVVAGMKIVLDRGPDGFMAKLHNSGDPIGDCAKGAVALLMIMRTETHGELPLQAGIPAALTLMLHGLQFLEQSKIVAIREPELDRANTQFANQMFWRLNITPAVLEGLTERVHQILQDPDMMSKIQMKAGLTKHPDAAEPTQIPGITSPTVPGG